ncbi:MAG: phosphoethanolamine transferase [Proteobacteria bacterium]|nr:phosphoethanolamine transferase [Pseudomonadota bacterium]
MLTDKQRTIALAALAAAPFIAMLTWAAISHRAAGSIVTLLVTSVLCWLLLAGCTRTWRYLLLAYFPFLLASVAYAGYTVGFGIVPGHTLAVLTVSASWEELRGLWTVWQGKWLLLPLLALLGTYLWLAWQTPVTPIFAGRTYLVTRVLLGLSVPAVAFAAHNTQQLIDGVALNPIVGTVMFTAGQVPRARAEIRGEAIQRLPYHATRAGTAEEVHVLVIGESARRGSWSVYGYARQTTPYLERIKDESIFFTHAVADANLTSLAVPMLLTGMTPEEVLSAKPHGTLLDLAREGGYFTTWLVNQDLGISTAIGVVADELVYPPDPQMTFFGRRVSDSALLPAYERALGRGGHSRFIGMHIMESHWEYFHRYPPAFQRFGDPSHLDSMSLLLKGGSIFPDLTDAYDNSTLYADWFLQQVIEQARKLTVPVTVTFVPDHGESLPQLDDGAAGHGQAVYSAAQFDIPAFIWANASYRAAHEAEFAALKANAGRRVRSHDFFYTEAQLMGITWPGAAPGRSIAASDFRPDGTSAYLIGGVPNTIPDGAD